jgi:hypothetical protein
VKEVASGRCRRHNALRNERSADIPVRRNAGTLHGCENSVIPFAVKRAE